MLAAARADVELVAAFAVAFGHFGHAGFCFGVAPSPRSRRCAESPSPAEGGGFRRANSRTSWLIFIEQNLGPHIEQKWAVLAPSAGRVWS